MDSPPPAFAPAAPAVSQIVREVTRLIQADGLAEGDRLPSIRQLSVRLGVRPHAVRDALLQAQAFGLIEVRPRSRAVVRSRPANGIRAQSIDGPPPLPFDTLRVPALDAARPLRDGQLADFAEAVRDVLDHDGHHVFHLLAARELIELETVRLVALHRRLEDLLPVRDEINAMNDAPDRADYVEHDLRFHLAIARIAGNPVLTAMLDTLLAELRPFLHHEPFHEACADQVRRSHAGIYRALVEGKADDARQEMRSHLQMAYDYLLGEVRTLPE